VSDEAGIFEKIVAGDVPAHRVYEDDEVLAFLDVAPVARGHTLLIPKRRHEQLSDLPEETAAALGAALPKLVRAVREASGCDGVNVLQNDGAAAGQEVMHVHFHLIPRYKPAAGPVMRDLAPERPGFRFNWPAGSLSDEDAEELQTAIAGALRS
jgi:histidine triad (HIT) family protein